MVVRTIRQSLTQLGVFTSHPVAFLIIAIYAGLWIYFQPGTFDWNAVATLAVWSMTLLIQRAEHRDTQAIHAKLDELIRAKKEARNEIIHVDQEEPEDIERLRASRLHD